MFAFGKSAVAIPWREAKEELIIEGFLESTWLYKADITCSGPRIRFPVPGAGPSLRQQGLRHSVTSRSLQ